MKQTNKKGEAFMIGYGTEAQINKQWADARYDREEALARIKAEKAKAVNTNPHVELSECDHEFFNYCPNCW
jgi:hypothetical protein